MKGYVSQLKYSNNEFRLLALLWANGGQYSGTLRNMCSDLCLSLQSNNTKKIDASLEVLSSNGDVSISKSGRTYHVALIEKQERSFEVDDSFIKLKENYIGKVFPKDEIAWENALRVVLWQIANREEELVKPSKISEECDMPVSLVNATFRALRRYFPEYQGGDNIRVKTNGGYDYKGRQNDYNAIGWSYRKNS